MGHGGLHVGFQTLSAFPTQVDVYRHLASTTDLNVHIYGVEGWEPSHIAAITYHEYESDAFGRYWILAFDGGSAEHQACGLIGQELEDGYRGFWTDDPRIVQRIVTTLTLR